MDAISDDGKNALSIIAFVGSVFSPYYAWAFERAGSLVDPENHCAVNVALYGSPGHLWSMTERGQGQLQRDQTHFVLGPSQLRWDNDHLTIELNEVCAPFPRRIRGTIKVHPSSLSDFVVPLDDAALHRWGPVAPCARVEVALTQPDLKWQGEAYLDSNEGDEPVTQPFHRWDWSRARLKDDSVAVLYDVRQTNASERIIAQRFFPNGSTVAFEPPQVRQRLPRTLWQVPRAIRNESGQPAQVHKTLEDGPFYARSLVQARVCGEQVVAVHETLEAQRLRSLPIRLMLPWRMPRRP